MNSLVITLSDPGTFIESLAADCYYHFTPLIGIEGKDDMKWLAWILTIVAGAIVSAHSNADTILLKNGGQLEGIVTSSDNGEVTVRLKSGSLSLPQSQIESIKKAPTTAPTDPNILPGWTGILPKAISTDWGGSLKQIPATVIDNGNLKNVPYYSYRAGDYEINIYGDPESPAGVEIGIYNELLTSEKAKANCQNFILSVIGDNDRKSAVKALGMNVGSLTANGWTVEVTPETAPDAYKGWWISVYSIGALDSQRASESELKQITQKSDPASTTQTTADLFSDKSTPTVTTSPRIQNTWSSADLAYARPSLSPSASSASVYDSNKSVFVHDYVRKNGTYVHSYYRSPPGLGHSHR